MASQSPSFPFEFYSKENMKLIIDICHDYLQDKYKIDIYSITDVKTHKRLVYDTMNDIYDKNKNKPHKDLNVIVLTQLRQHYIRIIEENIEKLSMTKSITNSALSRDTELYGKREININNQLPQNSKKLSEPIDQPYERMIAEREQASIETRPDISKLGRQIKELPEETESFMKKLQQLNSEREQLFGDGDINSQQGLLATRMNDDATMYANNQISTQDPKTIFDQHIKIDEPSSLLDTKSTIQQNNHITSSHDFLNPRPQSTKKLHRYLSLNSFDRDWNLEPLRFRYSINSMGNNNDLQRRYRNIAELSVGRVVIPEEIVERTSVTNQSLKPFFNHDFNFAYPYLILRIDEFNDVYDGTNDTVRKGFSKLIYEQSYKAPNGRGYIILKPIQKEKKVFYPAPLSSFGRLSLSLLRPNGALLNQSSDNYKLLKIEYEQFNIHYLKIVTNVYFDKNEFFVGDEIVIKGHNMTALTENMNDIYIRRFVNFINRVEGHEIKQIGSANDNGFFRSFYIQAPGVFNMVEGRFDIDNDVISTLNTYNSQINFCDPTIPTNGSMLNLSLQNTIALKITSIVDDADNIHTLQPL
jgi:hypothetical protein